MNALLDMLLIAPDVVVLLAMALAVPFGLVWVFWTQCRASREEAAMTCCGRQLGYAIVLGAIAGWLSTAAGHGCGSPEHAQSPAEIRAERLAAESPSERAAFLDAERCRSRELQQSVEVMPPAAWVYEAAVSCGNGTVCCAPSAPSVAHRAASAYYDPGDDVIVIATPRAGDSYCAAWVATAPRNEACNLVNHRTGELRDCWCRSSCGACA